MKLVISIDVEEEGLFSGGYPQRPEVRNLSHLEHLGFVSDEFGLPLTLLTAYSPAIDPACRDILKRWRDERGAEIGAHLHHWSTPPFKAQPWPEPVRTDRMDPELMRAKFETLMTTLENGFGQKIRSFRMGRWDFGRNMRSLLPEFGIETDSSIAPLRHAIGGPVNFLSPYDPHRLEIDGYDGPPVLEVPLTQVPVLKFLPRAAMALFERLPREAGENFLSGFSQFFALGIQPVWHPSLTMRMAARLHRGRGGQVLCMFLHSSELMPGQSPHFPDQAAVDRLCAKIRSFLAWLCEKYEVKGATLADLARDHDFAETGPLRIGPEK